MKDYYDIENWKEKPNKYFDFISKQKQDRNEFKFESPLGFEPIDVYSFLKLKISPYPNGFYTFVQRNKPLDNMIWWDFLLESDKGYINIWRTTHVLEAMYYFEEEGFDLNRFLNTNLKKFRSDIESQKKSYERHSLYINHFRSYKGCVEYLKKEIDSLDLNDPVSPEKHIVNKKAFEQYQINFKQYVDNSIKFHTLGKSLLLNSAFLIESFLNCN